MQNPGAADCAEAPGQCLTRGRGACPVDGFTGAFPNLELRYPQSHGESAGGLLLALGAMTTKQVNRTADNLVMNGTTLAAT